MKRLALALFAGSVVFYLGNVILLYATAGLPTTIETSPLLTSLENLAFVVLGGLGYLIVRRQPVNAVGWLAVVAGLSAPFEGFVSELTQYGLWQWGATALTMAAAWLALWGWIPTSFSVPLLLLLYPDGRLPSPRWRPVLWLTWAVVAFTLVVAAFAAGEIEDFPGLVNPLGLTAVTDAAQFAGPVVFNALPVLVLLGAASLIVRYRRSGPVERRQIKWLAWAGLVAVAFFFFTVSGAVDLAPWVRSLTNIGFVLLVGGAIFVAVTRHRLYDIDRLLSRTLTYAVVAAVLAGVYVAGALGLGVLVGESSPLAVAGATLAAAALFSPVRRRVQGWVDRRFDRGRYDAARVVEGFSARLRDEVELDGLTGDLSAVINQTLRPAAVSLWVRETGR
jgi:hypothetical protein